MSDLFSKPYAAIYEVLNEVREIFHREGRINDSNAKLDETVKFLSIHFADQLSGLRISGISELKSRATFSIDRLNKIFESIAEKPPFLLDSGVSIFGQRPAISFEAGDENVAFELFRATGSAFSAQASGKSSLDVLNEAFGHHVRDNFRSHVEDAQYMTPPEVVDFIVALASEEIFGTHVQSRDSDFVMMDPSCGVGSFITTWRREYEHKTRHFPQAPKLIAIGQDKIDRMARLSAINLIFARNSIDRIFVGNSVLDGSPLDAFNGKVDLILTNPPFGAKFPIPLLQTKAHQSVPFFAKTALNSKAIDSEILFLDRYLTLLRPGGLCFVVVPDGVISAKGTAAVMRQHLARVARLLAVVELPPVTFAQAGTRTKTAVLAFQKLPAQNIRSKSIFFGEIEDLGFEVSKRKGVPVKKNEGWNQLPEVLGAFRSQSDRERDTQGRSLTAVWRKIDPSKTDAWTPRRFKADEERVQKRVDDDEYSLIQLGDLVEPAVRRRSEKYADGTSFISVLHVIGEGLLDIAGVRSYQPITPGIPVLQNEVIISKLNPRIPRVLVVPNLGPKILCSSEFEVLRAKKGVSPYALAFLLMTQIVQEQIQALTAGTSASHSRVKPGKIYDLRIPWPTEKSKFAFESRVKSYQKASELLVTSMTTISDLRSLENAA